MKKDNKGYLMIEAAIVYPLYLVIIVFFIYMFLLAAQRAQMVSAAEQTIVFVKFICSGDAPVEEYLEGIDSKTTYELMKDVPAGNGTYNVYSRIFETSNSRAKELINTGGMEKIYKKFLGNTLLNNFDGGYKLETASKNYLLFTKIELDVSYKMKGFLNFSFIGAERLNKPSFRIHTSGVISDNAETARTMHFINYVVNRKVWYVSGDTENRKSLSGVVGEKINKIKEFFRN